MREILAEIARLVGRDPPRVRLPYAAVLPIAYLAEAFSRVSGRAGRVTLEGVRMSRKRMFFSSAKAQRELGYAWRPPVEAFADAVRLVSRARTHSGSMTSAPASARRPSTACEMSENGHAERDVARPLQQGNRKPEFRADAEERREQGVGRFLNAEAVRNEHRGTAHRADEGLDRDRGQKIDVRAHEPESDPRDRAARDPGRARCTAQESATRARDRVDGIEHRAHGGRLRRGSRQQARGDLCGEAVSVALQGEQHGAGEDRQREPDQDEPDRAKPRTASAERACSKWRGRAR